MSAFGAKSGNTNARLLHRALASRTPPLSAGLGHLTQRRYLPFVEAEPEHPPTPVIEAKRPDGAPNVAAPAEADRLVRVLGHDEDSVSISPDGRIIAIEVREAAIGRLIRETRCAFRGRRPLVPVHGDHLFRSMTTGW